MTQYGMFTEQIFNNHNGPKVAVSLKWCHTLLWRHNGPGSVSNHQPRDCLFNRLFRRRVKEDIKAPRHWPLCGEFTGEFPAQMASNAENDSISWRHHELSGTRAIIILQFWWANAMSKLSVIIRGKPNVTWEVRGTHAEHTLEWDKPASR